MSLRLSLKSAFHVPEEHSDPFPFWLMFEFMLFAAKQVVTTTVQCLLWQADSDGLCFRTAGRVDESVFLTGHMTMSLSMWICLGVEAQADHVFTTSELQMEKLIL